MATVQADAIFVQAAIAELDADVWMSTQNGLRGVVVTGRRA
jgi:hypothetical protein